MIEINSEQEKDFLERGVNKALKPIVDVIRYMASSEERLFLESKDMVGEASSDLHERIIFDYKNSSKIKEGIKEYIHFENTVTIISGMIACAMASKKLSKENKMLRERIKDLSKDIEQRY